MPFRVTNSNLLPPINTTNLAMAIKNAMAAAGFPVLFDEVSNPTRSRVIYEIPLNSNATFGKAYLEIEIDYLQVRQRLHTDWDRVNNAGRGSGPWGPQVQFNFSTEITLRGFEKNDECRLVGIRQSSTTHFLGYLRPINKPIWWNENNFLYCFIPGSNNFITWNGVATNPYGNATYTSNLGRAQMATANPITSKRDVVTGILLYSNSNQGACGRTSDELVMVSGSGLGFYDIIQVIPGQEEYTVLVPAAGGLALRTV